MGYIIPKEGYPVRSHSNKAVENMLLCKEESGSFTYSIFLTGKPGEKSLPPEYIIELLLLYDSGIFDVDTISILFDVSINDIMTFADPCPMYGGAWEESIATMWTKELHFYETDLESLSWMTRYAIKRAELAVKMEKTLMEATEEMYKELEEDAGWGKDNSSLRTEGLIDKETRDAIREDWVDRIGE